MNKWLTGVLVAIMLVGSAAAGAQETPKPSLPAAESGVINGRAINLVRPVYPPDALAKNIGGQVTVRVTIDGKTGRVIAAAPVAGRPVLMEAAVDAAKASTFSAYEFNGKAVDQVGMITYNFIEPSRESVPANDWLTVGITLGSLSNAGVRSATNSARIARMVPSDWTAEQAQIRDLAKARGDSFQEAPVSASGGGAVEIVTSAVKPIVPATSADVVALAEALAGSIQGRLSTAPADLWKFNLGRAFGRSPGGTTAATAKLRLEFASDLRELLAKAPPEISSELLGLVKRFAELAERGVRTDADGKENALIHNSLRTLAAQ